ncbi:uncharacterized protein TNCV_3747511 [Trichonephila clavipes]|nr:uncharacterized protein TNCV_3747511 [Trichonephila clavipes]
MKLSIMDKCMVWWFSEERVNMHDDESAGHHRGLCGPVPYKTLVEEEVQVEPVVTYNCDHCEYRSPTQKGLRCHRITVHRIGVGVKRTLDTHGRPLAYFG